MGADFDTGRGHLAQAVPAGGVGAAIDGIGRHHDREGKARRLEAWPGEPVHGFVAAFNADGHGVLGQRQATGQRRHHLAERQHPVAAGLQAFDMGVELGQCGGQAAGLFGESMIGQDNGGIVRGGRQDGVQQHEKRRCDRRNRASAARRPRL